ncbi:unnamed protein product [Danaus chrysippus]|uniref:GPI mannosyltransferase 2 n=1 Tax=Danaus chrysippus TaxID=151541 RepID=A0A8J2QP18_9NEOP|nr:unnamed protein product [Danaus chrysippus]
MVSNILIPDHDAKVFISPEDPTLRSSRADNIVQLFVGGMKRWDAQYFIHIAQYGYTYENCLAFFPMFPLIVSKMSNRQKQYSKTFGANDPVFFVYIVHVLFLSIFCLVFVHIQVTTRLLASASPVLYWICSSKINVGPTPTSDQNTINEHFRRIGIGKRIPSHHLSIANLEGVDNMYSKWKTFIVSRKMPDFQSRFIQCYFLGYLVIGTVLFSNFYPWT